MYRALLENLGHRKGLVLAVAVIVVCAWAAVIGPQGLRTLLDKRREIRQLQEQNAALASENERRRDRIQRLQESRSEQELEIRRKLKLVRPGETTFILPEDPK